VLEVDHEAGWPVEHTDAERDLGAQTEIVLSHELPDEPTIRREHEGGWNGCLDSLLRYLET
jgi:hypothetical protein